VENLIAVASLLGGLVCLAGGGDFLVAGATNLALRMKVSPLFVGITVVAAGTSLPELVVCVIAQFEQSSGLAIGNIVGSNIFNLGLVLGLILILNRQRRVNAGSFEIKLLVLSTLALLIPLYLDQRSDGISTLTWSVGIVLEIVFLILLLLIYRTGRKQSSVLREVDEMTTGESSLKVTTSLILGTLLLWIGGEFLVNGAITLAKSLDIKESTIGLTIVAAGTGAPELFASLAALRRGSSEIAIGNVLGSNLFNFIAIVGAAAIVSPLEIRIGEIQMDLVVMVIMTISICLLLVPMKSPRLQNGLGVFLLLLYALWLLSIVILKQ